MKGSHGSERGLHLNQNSPEGDFGDPSVYPPGAGRPGAPHGAPAGSRCRPSPSPRDPRSLRGPRRPAAHAAARGWPGRGAAPGTRVRGGTPSRGPGALHPRVAAARPRGPRRPSPALPVRRLRCVRATGHLATYWGGAGAAPRARWWARAPGGSRSGRRLAGPRGEERPGPLRCRRRAGHVGAPLCSRAGGGARARAGPPPPARAGRPPPGPSRPRGPIPGVGGARPLRRGGACSPERRLRGRPLPRAPPGGRAARGRLRGRRVWEARVRSGGRWFPAFLGGPNLPGVAKAVRGVLPSGVSVPLLTCHAEKNL